MSVFEKIIKGELPCNKVLETADFLAFHDIAPKAPVHILAIPKKFALDFQSIESERMAAFSAFIQEVVRVVGLDKSGYRLITNIGSDGGQEVPYIHFHILGGAKLRWDNLAENISAKEMLDAAKKGM